MAQPELLRRVRLTEAETRLARIDPGYGRASTTSRLDAFLLPDSLTFAEYNAESPAGLAYAENLGEVFDGLDLMARFRERFEASYFRLSTHLLDALLASYAEWGGRASPPTILITDFRDVPTWSEFLILKDRFEARGVPTVVADPRDLSFDGTTLVADGRRIDLVYRRVLVNDVIARADDCRVLVDAIASGTVCMANALRCKIPHKKAFFALLTDDAVTGPGGLCPLSDAERAIVAAAIPWTRVVEDVRTSSPHHGTIDLLAYAREHRDSLVLKPNDEYGGSGVTLGWETSVGGVGRRAGQGGRRERPGRNRRSQLGAAAADPDPPRDVPRRVRPAARRDAARHAGRLRAVPVPRPADRLPDAPERLGPRQRHVGRRTGGGVRGPGPLAPAVSRRRRSPTRCVARSRPRPPRPRRAPVPPLRARGRSTPSTPPIPSPRVPRGPARWRSARRRGRRPRCASARC